MAHNGSGFQPQSPITPAPESGGPSIGTLLAFAQGILAGVGGTFIATRSVLVTIIAGLIALAMMVIVLTCRR